MAITATKLGVRFASPGFNLIEFSLAFDTDYPTSGGESLDLSTAFPSKAFLGIVTKPCTWTASGADAEFTSGTSDGSTNCNITLYSKGAAKADLSSTSLDGHAATMRLLVAGY